MKVITGFHSIEERVNVFVKEKEKTQKISPLVKDCKIFFDKTGPRVKKILESAKKAGITCEKTDGVSLDQMVKGLPEVLQDHRGIVMTLSGEEKSRAPVD